MNTKKGKQKTIKSKSSSKSSSKSHTKSKAGTRRKKFTKAQCSPLVKNSSDKRPYTCYTTQQLHKMRDLWNARHPDARIEHTESKKIWENYAKIWAIHAIGNRVGFRKNLCKIVWVVNFTIHFRTKIA